ncbi:MAG: hypothetical protein M1814_001165 [Vezdaea aestivalis]|nr:MAG: hypothetical protein M1814_001165 [Vezdaea aestivalis]
MPQNISYNPIPFDDEAHQQTLTSPAVPDRPATSAHMATTTIKVDGMTCGACTSAIESGFEDVPGVGTFSVSLVMERAVLVHDPARLTAEEAKTIIEDRGFDAEVLSTDLEDSARGKTAVDSMTVVRSTTVAIDGMTCGACTSAIESGLKDLDGVLQFDISLLAERAVIIHDLSKVSPEQIVETIEDRGFDARIITSVQSDTNNSQTTTSIQLKLFGVRDSSAASALEEGLRALSGVASVVVSLSTSRATVSYNPTTIGLRALVEAVEALGYNALVAEADDNNAQLESLSKMKEITEWRRAFIFSLSFAIPVFCISMIFPMFIKWLDFGSTKLPIPGLYLGDVVCLILTVPVQFGIGKRFYVSALRSLKHKSPTMDVLVVLGTSAAFFFSCAAMIVSIFTPPHSRPATVFDTSTMLITFITLGRYLENRAKGQTSKALSRLMSLTPSMAIIYVDPIAAEKASELDLTKESKEKSESSADVAINERSIPTELIQVGDIVILRPGDKIPADGTVTRGEAYIDESMVTGEAMPIFKTKGSQLIGGTVNGSGTVDFRVTRAGRDTQLSQIVKLVQEAQSNRAPIQRMADLVAGYFVPTIIGLGLFTFVSWMVLSHILPHPPKIFLDEKSGGTFMVCLKLCISVIVFACPCALGLSTPTAVMVGTGVGAENGILVKGGAALEIATKINHVVFDKTGTLTMGKMSVSNAHITSPWSTSQDVWWSLVGLAESHSEHPIGQAILSAARLHLNLDSESLPRGTLTSFSADVGKGVTALITISSKTYTLTIGNASYMTSNSVTFPPLPSQDPSTTTIHIAIDTHHTGTLSLSDTLKPTAPACILALHRLGITTSLVTGDTRGPATHMGKLAGIPLSNIHSNISPSQKQTLITGLRSEGLVVAMVGDGINDSPALASADIGIAMSSGTDVAMEAADIVLMRPLDLLSVPAALHLARTIFNRIKLNLVWACAYNLVGLPFAMGVFLPLGLHLHPMAAGAAMACSSVSVVLSSLALKWWSRPRWMTVEVLEREGGGKREADGWVERVWRVGGRVLRRRRAGGDRGAYVPLTEVEPV